MARSRSGIIVSGRLAGATGHGGWAWVVLQYLTGLRRLGFDVTFLETVPPPEPAVDAVPLGRTEPAQWFSRVLDAAGLLDQASLVCVETGEHVGLPAEALKKAIASARLLINLSGHLKEAAYLEKIPARLFVDLDPAFTQLWHAVEGIDMNLAGHTHFATVGLNIGDPDCPIPDCGRTWIRTFQPVVPDFWEEDVPLEHDSLTTVVHWRSYGSVTHHGIHYGQRAHSMRHLASLPHRCSESFFILLGIHPGETKDLALLKENGWRLGDPLALAGTPEKFRRFVSGSKAEISIAKSGYVLSHCGWFSDRSQYYLACGRPVVAQRTGFEKHLPVGDGILDFETVSEAAAAVECLKAGYERRRAAAREIAREYFAFDRVLPRLLNAAGVEV